MQIIIRLALAAMLAVTLNLQSAFAQDATPQNVRAPGARRHKVKVSDPALAQEIAAQGGHLVADYGSFQLFDAPEMNQHGLTNGEMEIHDEYNVVMLNAKHLDTTRTDVKARRKHIGNFSGKRLHMVQFVGPVQPQWRDDLIAAGVRIVSYIPENTYLVYGDAASIAKVQAMATVAPHVQWESAYGAEDKIHPKARMTDEKGRPRDIGTDLFSIQILADDAANTNTLKLINRLTLEPLKQQQSVSNYLNVVARLSPKSLSLIAAQPEVISIQPYFPAQIFCERQDQIIAGNISNNVPTGPGYLAWLASKGFTQAQFNASAFTVDVSDTGIDEGTTSPAHFGLHVGGSLSAAGRVTYNRLETTTNEFFTTLAGCDGHGTINAHIIAGYDDLAGYPFADANGFHYGLGVCPFVNVGSSVIFNPLNSPESFNYPNYNLLQSQAYHSGARISNNSWGANTSGLYTTDSQNYDALVRDAEPSGSAFPVAGNQEMVIVFAAGNSGPDLETLGAPATAKNVISVGAADNVQPFGPGLSDNGGIGDSQSSSANEIASFSSRGPCADGRTKPDIMAPGTHVSGGVAQWSLGVPNPDGTGTADPCFNGTGVNGGPNGEFFPTNQQFYTVSSGTSHAAPCVAGGCALIRQYFINNTNLPPSAAMTKAYLLNSARYMNGATANDTLPSNLQGMGEMNLGTAFDGTPRILRDQLSNDLFTASGQSRVFYGTISDTTKPFRVTVAWTDAPGSTTASAAYNNNLDLIVTVGGNVYKGNVFKGQYSVPGGTADYRNNVESVFLPAGVGGGFVVKVNGTSINSDGVPNNSTPLDQDFALVVYNATTAPTPIIANAGAVLVTEGCAPGNGAVDPGETVTMNFSLQNIGAINTANVVATLQSSGMIFPSGAQVGNYGALTTNGAPVSQPFTFTANGPCGGNIIATLQLQDGSVNLGTVNFNISLGKFIPATTSAQNFDGSQAPALPVNWTTTNSGNGLTNWITVSNVSDSGNNSAFVADIASNGVSTLISPSIPIVSPTAQLSFRQNYDLENSQVDGRTAYDGGVLEISIGGSAFLDILTAGGSFVTGAYNSSLNTNYHNPLGGRLVWSGNSGGFVTTTVTLPPTAAGQNVVFKWRLAMDDGNSELANGWYVDTVSVLDGSYVCCGSATDLGITISNLPNVVVVGSNLVYTATVTNLGPQAASGLVFTDVLPTNVTFVSGSPGCVFNAGSVVCNFAGLSNGVSTNITVTVVPTSPGLVTNVVSIAAATPDFDSANNVYTNIVMAELVPFFTTQSTELNITVLVSNSTSFTVTAGGTGPLMYQWQFNGVNLAGQNSNTLSLTNVQYFQAGGYALVVTNAAGSVTSPVITLTVLTPPKVTNSIVAPLLANLAPTANNVSLSLKSTVGVSYVLQYKNSLSDTNWISILPPMIGNDRILVLHDPSGMQPHRFYRVQASTAP